MTRSKTAAKRRTAGGLLVVAGLVAGCSPSPSTAPPTTPATPPPATGYAMPDRTLTPGAATSDITQICPHVNPAIEAARPDSAEKVRVFTAYRIPPGEQRLYVIDHRISLSIGGENVPQNLWPQPVAQAKVKDHVEAVLHAGVCRKVNPVPLAAAQEAEAKDWVTAPKMLGLSS
jgi:hypothetical protein